MVSPGGPLTLSVLSVAGLASVGAGAIHATAAGMHSEHRQALWVFIALAVFQIGWGALTLVRSGRLVGLVGAAGNAVAVGGWVMAKVMGISFVDGLEGSEGVQLADGLAAALAAVAVVVCLAVASGVMGRVRPGFRGQPSLIGVAAVAVVALVLPGMASAGRHGHGDEDPTAQASHGHGEEASAVDGNDQMHGLRPYDPTKPIDLGGVEGVTPEQQARAENLLAWNLIRLPQWSDPAVAEAHGYHSIGDAATGYEHYINWALIDDGRVLDPDHPESLVYQRRDGVPTLVAAMYMLPTGSTFDDVPDIGGPLTQWHIHNDLCFSTDPVAPKVAGVVPPEEECRPGTQRLAHWPMIHIWVVPHRCGPFAALEGVAGGQVRDGEERLCDHVHGA